ncbi:MAG TPA: rhamnan synthesis F family protein [Candidatus Methylacidiphilales bacterium]|nr:rhamnan synthesis F family protein [Candidatus Methylacidiphilales bacterium]
MMVWYYLLKRVHALSGKKVLIEVPFHNEKSEESPGRIAVIAHCFYLDLADELFDYICHIPYPYRLFVSTDTDEKKNIVTEKLKARKISSFEVRCAVNRGRDIAPKYITFRDVYAECDYFVHLHGKKSPHMGDGTGNRWRKYLLHSLLGSPEIIASIFTILKDPRIGLVFPDPYEPNLPQLRWAANYDISVALANKLKIKISKDNCPEYPSGSMFWAKASVVRPLLDLNLQFEDFPVEKGRVDGELSHAIERMIAPIAHAQGLRGQRIIAGILNRRRKTIRVSSALQVPEAITLCLRNEDA